MSPPKFLSDLGEVLASIKSAVADVIDSNLAPLKARLTALPALPKDEDQALFDTSDLDVRQVRNLHAQVRGLLYDASNSATAAPLLQKLETDVNRCQTAV